MAVVLSNPQVTVNNLNIVIVPNSVSFTEGFGETMVRAASGGGGSVVQVRADDITDNFSEVKFSLNPTLDNIAIARAWKSQPGQNVVTVSGTVIDSGVSSTFSRTFQQASITNNFEVPLGADTQIDLEWKSDPAT